MFHTKTIGIKLIVSIIVVYSIFGIFGNASLSDLLWVSILLTAISYFIGDRLILPRYGNVVATIADFPLAFLTLWLLGSFLVTFETPIISTSLMAAFFLTCAEPLIHAYLQNQTEGGKREQPIATDRLQTEFAEETDAQDINKKSKRNDRNDFNGYY
ncbi:Protein of unknown function [Oceanobacillus limi]|uniref:DUF2512 family protein n=1 Tax=Oceanobacillus limi TaxID=930131 RepID=A0A1I0FMQ0_9BACI|nr:YndM family protein [Oceanobacillus limi]SET58838.1 Protein of unknown function [Oceanobacillus limi]